MDGANRERDGDAGLVEGELAVAVTSEITRNWTCIVESDQKRTIKFTELSPNSPTSTIGCGNARSWEESPGPLEGGECPQGRYAEEFV